MREGEGEWDSWTKRERVVFGGRENERQKTKEK